MFLGISTTSFQKDNLGWPHQRPTEKVPILMKNLIFDDPFLIIIGHFVARDDPTLRVRKFFVETGIVEIGMKRYG